jgi:hypothetical protein
MEEGGLAADAILRFRRVNGYWPLRTNELPDGSATVPSRWRYVLFFDDDSNPRWELQWHHTFGFVSYTFSVNHLTGMWNASFLGQSPSNLPQHLRPFGDKAPVSDPRDVIDKLAAARSRSPDHHELYTKAIISLSHECGMNDRARDELSQAIPRYSDPWFLAHQSIAVARQAKAIPETTVLPIEEWAVRENDLAAFVRAGCAYHAVGLPEHVKRCLRRALGCSQPLHRFGDTNPYHGWYWDGAVLLTRHEAHRLLLDWCNSWERYHESQGYGGTDLFVFRAYAHLRLGEFGRKEQAVTFLGGLEQAGQWSRNTDELAAAIQSRNRDFRYDPGPFPALPTFKFYFR